VGQRRNLLPEGVAGQPQAKKGLGIRTTMAHIDLDEGKK
jgi:hypothetical protein